MDTLKQMVRDLDTESWPEFLGWVVGEERARRDSLPAVEQARAEVVTELQDAGKLEKPEVATEEQAKQDAAQVPDWQDPGTDHALMYHQGDVVRYGDKIVRSTHPGLNHWEPGTLGFDGRIWEVIGAADTQQPENQGEGEAESTPEPAKPAAPAYKQPSGAHDAYKQGDRVTYNGNVYESTINGNVWSPDSYPQGWKKL